MWGKVGHFSMTLFIGCVLYFLNMEVHGIVLSHFASHMAIENKAWISLKDNCVTPDLPTSDSENIELGLKNVDS